MSRSPSSSHFPKTTFRPSSQSCEAGSGSSSTPTTGKVVRAGERAGLTIDNQIDPRRHVRIKAIFDNKESVLFPQQFVNVRLLATRSAASWSCPTWPCRGGRRALRLYGRRRSHRPAPPDQDRRDRRRRRGRPSRELKAGESVVVEGADGVRAGSTVDVRPAQAKAASVSPSRAFILRPVATSLLMVGAAAGRRRRVSASCRSRRCRRSTTRRSRSSRSIPGASPDVMASSVTAPLERQFGQMPGPEADDVDQLGRAARSSRCSSTLDLEHRRRRAGGAGGDQRGRHLPAARPAEPADLQQDRTRPTRRS